MGKALPMWSAWAVMENSLPSIDKRRTTARITSCGTPAPERRLRAIPSVLREHETDVASITEWRTGAPERAKCALG